MSDKSKTYLISTKLEEQTIEGRDEAIATAKAWSNTDSMQVAVERADGRVRMTFREGSLIDYVYETRKGRSVQ